MPATTAAPISQFQFPQHNYNQDTCTARSLSLISKPYAEYRVVRHFDRDLEFGADACADEYG